MKHIMKSLLCLLTFSLFFFSSANAQSNPPFAAYNEKAVYVKNNILYYKNIKTGKTVKIANVEISTLYDLKVFSDGIYWVGSVDEDNDVQMFSYNFATKKITSLFNLKDIGPLEKVSKIESVYIRSNRFLTYYLKPVVKGSSLTEDTPTVRKMYDLKTKISYGPHDYKVEEGKFLLLKDTFDIFQPSDKSYEYAESSLDFTSYFLGNNRLLANARFENKNGGLDTYEYRVVNFPNGPTTALVNPIDDDNIIPDQTVDAPYSKRYIIFGKQGQTEAGWETILHRFDSNTGNIVQKLFHSTYNPDNHDPKNFTEPIAYTGSHLLISHYEKGKGIFYYYNVETNKKCQLNFFEKNLSAPLVLTDTYFYSFVNGNLKARKIVCKK